MYKHCNYGSYAVHKLCHKREHAAVPISNEMTMNTFKHSENVIFRYMMYIGFPEILSRAVFWSIVVKDQSLFTFFLPSFNHNKGFWTEAEQCCVTLLLCRETPAW